MSSLPALIRRAIASPDQVPAALTRRLRHYYQLYVLRDETVVSAARWFRDRGDETLRLDYRLDAGSVVMDLGGYKGDFAAEINRRYGCTVLLYEPVRRFYDECIARFAGNARVQCFNYGLSDAEGAFQISHLDDGSSFIRRSTEGNSEEARLERFSDELLGRDLSHIDLLKLNIEGGEFPLLLHILAEGLASRIVHLQIQFHDFYPDARRLREQIRKELARTHDEQWNYPFVWESWTRKEAIR